MDLEKLLIAVKHHGNRNEEKKDTIKYLRTDLLPKGSVIYNAKETDDDKLICDGESYHGRAIVLWEKKAKRSRGYHCPACGTLCNNDPQKGNAIVGAHVVLDKKKRLIQKGDSFYIVPLCSSCNGKNKDSDFIRLNHSSVDGLCLQQIA